MKVIPAADNTYIESLLKYAVLIQVNLPAGN
jgi:hypothetical protein